MSVLTPKEVIMQSIEYLDERKTEMTDAEYIKEMKLLQDSWKLLCGDDLSDDEEEGIEMELIPYPNLESNHIPSSEYIFSFFKEGFTTNTYWINILTREGEEEHYYLDFTDNKTFDKFITKYSTDANKFYRRIKAIFNRAHVEN